jgi:hypothetical protein
MANIKIVDLPELESAPESTDLFIIQDMSSGGDGITKKILSENLSISETQVLLVDIQDELLATEQTIVASITIPPGYGLTYSYQVYGAYTMVIGVSGNDIEEGLNRSAIYYTSNGADDDVYGSNNNAIQFLSPLIDLYGVISDTVLNVGEINGTLEFYVTPGTNIPSFFATICARLFKNGNFITIPT